MVIPVRQPFIGVCVLLCWIAQAACFGEVAGKGGAVPQGSPAASRTGSMLLFHGWLTDSSDNLWAFFGDTDKTLSQWNGNRWIAHSLPESRRGFYELVADTQGRIWLFPYFKRQGQRVLGPLIFDPHQDQWTVFDTNEAAFESMLKNPPRFQGEVPDHEIPAFGADGKQIAFLSREREIQYFDGNRWRAWSPKEITRTQSLSALERPFFDSKNRLSVMINRSGWQWDESKGWMSVPLEPLSTPPKNSSNLPPEGCVTDSPDSLACDNRGTFWLTWRQRLYKARAGACVPVFREGESDPLVDGRKVTKAWVDRNGTAFLQTNSNRGVIIAPREKQPHTTLTIHQTSDDAVEIKMDSGGGSGVQFRWRLDARPVVSGTSSLVVLKNLPAGRHQLVATAINSELLEDSIPAKADFVIKVDPEKQMAFLIGRLSDPNFAKRKEAIAGLAFQPAAVALPALKAARPKVDESVQWWIDAAIQQIERESKRQPKQEIAP